MRILFGACLLAALSAAVVVRAQSARPMALQPLIVPAADLKWVDNPAMKGAQQAVLWGDPAKGGFAALRKFPAGTVLPVHTHTNAMREVVVAGTISLAIGSGAARDLAPQSYTLIPGGMKHTATCKAGADCVYFETSTGTYDLKTDAGTR